MNNNYSKAYNKVRERLKTTNFEAYRKIKAIRLNGFY